MESLSKKELKEILIKNWMTHDAMWLLHCFRKTGIETTNKINKAASAGLGLVEAKRLKKLLGIDDIQTAAELKRFIQSYWSIISADFMKFTYKFIKNNELQCEMHECWAHEGIKRIGIIDEYECGIYGRIDGLFKGLGLKFEVTPQINGCLIHQGKKCIRHYRFQNFEDNGGDKK